MIMKVRMWHKIRNKLCGWLVGMEIDDIYTRMQDDLDYEKDRLRKEYADKHRLLELKYADIERHNDYLMKLITERENLFPKPMIIKDSELN